MAIGDFDEIEFLKRAVSIRSLSTDESEIANFLKSEMARAGFSSLIDEAGNVIGIIGPGDAEKVILFAGHMDTVPGEISVRIEDNNLYGRGSVDAKGPLCAFTAAAAKARLTNTRIIIAASKRNARAPKERAI
jgi:LysW-gamma-L-lysine carboxypeptidase